MVPVGAFLPTKGPSPSRGQTHLGTQACLLPAQVRLPRLKRSSEVPVSSSHRRHVRTCGCSRATGRRACVCSCGRARCPRGAARDARERRSGRARSRAPMLARRSLRSPSAASRRRRSPTTRPAAPAAPVIVEKVTEEPKVYEFPKGRSLDTRRSSRAMGRTLTHSPAQIGASTATTTRTRRRSCATCASRLRWTKTTRTWRSVAEGGCGSCRRAPLPYPLLLANAVGSPRVRRPSART